MKWLRNSINWNRWIEVAVSILPNYVHMSVANSISRMKRLACWPRMAPAAGLMAAGNVPRLWAMLRQKETRSIGNALVGFDSTISVLA